MGHRHTKAVLNLKRRFGDNLVLARDRAGLSRAETSTRSGLHITQIGLLEHGARLPRIDTILRLAGALEVPPCDLLVGMAWRLAVGQGRSGAYGLSEEAATDAREAI